MHAGNTKAVRYTDTSEKSSAPASASGGHRRHHGSTAQLATVDAAYVQTSGWPLTKAGRASITAQTPEHHQPVLGPFSHAPKLDHPRAGHPQADPCACTVRGRGSRGAGGGLVRTGRTPPAVAGSPVRPRPYGRCHP